MGAPDRGLIVREPWISLILSGKKTWEMRSRSTNIRGRIGLIEAGSGLIVGEVDIVNCFYPLDQSEAKLLIKFHQIKDLSLIAKWNTPWVMSNPKRYDNPVPYSHPRGAVTWVNLAKQISG